MVAEEFDPYLELLGIPKSDQPPNAYRLLGIPEFTSNKQVIANGASRQLQFLRRVGGDQYLDAVQRMLNEISKARILLLDDKAREAYDGKIRKLNQAKQKNTKSGGLSDDELSQISSSMSQSLFDLSAPSIEEIGRGFAVQLIHLSGLNVGKVDEFQTRSISIGPSSLSDLVVATSNRGQLRLERELDQWILTADQDSTFAVNGRLVDGLSTIRDGDILRFSISGPDFQFIDQVDVQRHLEQLAEYDSQVPRTKLVRQESSSRSSAPVATAARRRASGQPVQATAVGTATATRAPARQQRETKLVRKPVSNNKSKMQKVVDFANTAVGNDKQFRKKHGAVVDVQMGVFWLAVGAVVAAVVAGVIYGIFLK